MSRYSKFARIVIPAFTVAVLAALSIQQPATARATSTSTSTSTAVEKTARAVLSHGALDDILTGYVKVLVRNGQAGSAAREHLLRMSARPQRLVHARRTRR